MVLINNLVLMIIVINSILKFETCAEEMIACTTNEDCASDEFCMNNECVNRCLYHECSRKNEVCFTKNHEPLCLCDFGFVRKANLECEKPYCIVDQECYANEVCAQLNTEPVTTCQCRPGYEEDVYSVERCISIHSFMPCMTDVDCSKLHVCFDNYCYERCQPKNCGENEECPYIYGKCQCKTGYRLNVIDKCEPYCISNKNCQKNEVCEPSNGIFKCICGDEFYREHVFPYRCLFACKNSKDCPKGEACSDGKCIEMQDLVEIDYIVPRAL